MTAPPYQASDASFSNSTICDSNAISNSLNGNKQCFMVQGPVIIGPLSVTNISGNRDSAVLSGQIIEEMSTRAAAESRGQQDPIARSVEQSGTSQRPDSTPKCKILANLSRLRNRDPRSELQEGCCSTIRGAVSRTSGRSITTFCETRESIKLPMKSDVIQRYMKSQFFLSEGAIALWSPSLGANACRETKKFNVCVGDVGFFTKEGGFLVLFNIFLSVEENTDLGFDPPPDLEPYGPVHFWEEISIRNMIPRTNYRHCDGVFTQDLDVVRDSSRTYFASYRLHAPPPRKGQGIERWGSVLDLPYGLWKDQMHPRTISKLEAYLKLHAKDWYRYYREQPTGPTIPDGPLKVVTSSYKCSSWALATCSTGSSDEIFARLYKTSNSDLYYDWKKHDEVDVKTGPLEEETQEDEEPQCVAVEVFSFEISRNIRSTTANIRSTTASIVSNWKTSLRIGSTKFKGR